MDAERLYRKQVNAWCLYDWANSAFATTIMAAVLPIFYATVAASGLDKTTATAYWGYTTAIALAVAAILSPLIGAAADALGARKKFLIGSALFGAAVTGLLVTVGEGQWLRASIIFGFAQLGFVISFVCYDSLLSFVARPGELDRVSTRGYALGYLGGGILLTINMVMILFPSLLGIPSAAIGVRLSFVSVTIWWALFTFPLARRVAEPPPAGTRTVADAGELVRRTFGDLKATFREIRRHKEAFRFLLAFWIYNDGIGTIIKMATIYGTEIGIGRDALIGALLVVQFVGFPFSLIFGKIAGRIGARPAILFGLAVYSGIAVFGFFLSEAWHFWVLAVVVGMVQGGTQALSRSLFASLTPRDRSAQWFGFYSVSHRFAGIAGPLLFALIAQLAGSSRYAIVSLVVFFVVGAWMLTRVDLEKGEGALIS